MTLRITSVPNRARITSSMILKSTLAKLINKNMKISKVLHVVSVISGVLGVLSFLGLFGGGMMSGFSGMMGYGQGYASMPMGSIGFFLIAIWLQIGTIHHMILEKKGELV